MSTANPVPETWQLTGDDAKDTLERTDRATLVKDSVTRLRFSDGFSHARSMAFLTILVFVQAVIGAVGIASALGSGWLSSTIVTVLRSIVPGPAGRVLTQAVEQAHQSGGSGQWIAILVGTVGALVTATTLMGQVERAMNRLYGVEQDRPTAKKYAHALLLALSAGVLATLAFLGLALGRGVASGIGGEMARTIWNLVRWPLGLALLIGSTALIFKWAPRRHQPSWSWLASGAVVSVALIALVTLALNLFFQFSTTFGATYGPLAGIVALAFWGFFSSVALLAGAAMAAQLEAVRAGVAEPTSRRKVAASTASPSGIDAEPAAVGRVSP